MRCTELNMCDIARIMSSLVGTREEIMRDVPDEDWRKSMLKGGFIIKVNKFKRLSTRF